MIAAPAVKLKMMLKWTSLIILLTTLFAWPETTTFVQDAVPGEILKRTQLIKNGNASGTTFTLQHQGKLYLVKARRVVAGLSVDKPTIEPWRSNKWGKHPAAKNTFPSITRC
ncbi:MAG: hypothetical protein WA851_15175 [Xanthobacteraceae bacterium]